MSKRRRVASRAEQLNLDLRKRGGKRKGAGRRSVQGERRHEKRPKITGRDPLHVTIKLKEGLPSLRQKTLWKVFRRATEKARLKGLRLVHFAILSNHAHLLIEAENNETLSCGLKSLLITLAKALNKLAVKKGRTLRDRYHLHVLKTPNEVRRVLSYIFANDAKHRQSQKIRIDFFSSTALVQDARQRSMLLRGYSVQDIGSQNLSVLRSLLRGICELPRTWLLSAGWMRARAQA